MHSPANPTNKSNIQTPQSPVEITSSEESGRRTAGMQPPITTLPSSPLESIPTRAKALCALPVVEVYSAMIVAIVVCIVRSTLCVVGGVVVHDARAGSFRIS